MLNHSWDASQCCNIGKLKKESLLGRKGYKIGPQISSTIVKACATLNPPPPQGPHPQHPFNLPGALQKHKSTAEKV